MKPKPKAKATKRQMSLEFSKKQKEYIRNANARWNMKIGAVRSGKSYLDIAFMIPYRLRQRKDLNGLNVILGVSKETIERNVLQPMREIYTSAVVGTINSRNIANVCGVPVYCLGASKSNQVAVLQGSSIKYCYGDEIAKWHCEVFAMLKSRLDKPYSCFDGACNPEYPSHWLKEFIDDEEIDSYIQKYTLFDNPFLAEDYITNLCKEYQGTVYYNRLILGEWALAEGLIYPMYQDCFAEPPKDWRSKTHRLYLSIDYGTLNAFAALLWVIVDDVAYAFDYYYYSGREEGSTLTDKEYANALDEQFGEYADEYNKLKTIVDPSAASFITELKRHKRYAVIHGDNAVLDGIRETASAMKQGKIKISPKIKEWKMEVEGYVWDENSSEDRPIKVNDHCLTGGTLVMTENGEKPISELVGTSGNVWSYNTEAGIAELKPYHNCRLTQKQAEIYEIETTDGRFIHCTSEHPLLTKRGYVLAKDLRESDKIVDIKIVDFAGISSVGIKAIRKVGKADVYNMEVEDNHNFAIEGGLIVHNCMDAMRYFVKTTHIVKPKQKKEPIIYGRRNDNALHLSGL